MSATKNIRLNKSQKSILTKMRNNFEQLILNHRGEFLFKDSCGSCKKVGFKNIAVLLANNFIKDSKVKTTSGSIIFNLTKLGKTIEL